MENSGKLFVKLTLIPSATAFTRETALPSRFKAKLAPRVAPRHWHIVYEAARTTVMFLANMWPQLTAGFMCPPEMPEKT